MTAKVYFVGASGYHLMMAKNDAIRSKQYFHKPGGI